MATFPFNDGTGRRIEVEWSKTALVDLCLLREWIPSQCWTRQLAIPHKLAPQVAGVLWPEVVEGLQAIVDAPMHPTGDDALSMAMSVLSKMQVMALNALARLEPPAEDGE